MDRHKLDYLRKHPLFPLRESDVRSHAYYAWQKCGIATAKDPDSIWIAAEQELAELIENHLDDNKVTFNSHTPKGEFCKIYKLVTFRRINEMKRKEYIGNKEDRTCSICHKAEPEVAFRQVKHIIPELLGNNRLLSNEECDTCNEKFGALYENELGHMLIFDRAIAGQRKKGSRSAKLKTRRGGGSLGGQPIGDPVQVIQVENDDSLTTSLSGNELHIEVNVPAYIPLYAGKSIAKSAWLLLSKDMRKKYEFLGEWIENEENTEFGAVLNRVFVPGLLSSPLGIYIWEKYEENDVYPEIVIMVLFMNTILQLAVSTNKGCIDYVFCDVPTPPNGMRLSRAVFLLRDKSKERPEKAFVSFGFSFASAIKSNKIIEIFVETIDKDEVKMRGTVNRVQLEGDAFRIEVSDSGGDINISLTYDEEMGIREFAYEVNTSIENLGEMQRVLGILFNLFSSKGIVIFAESDSEEICRFNIDCNSAALDNIIQLQESLKNTIKVNKIITIPITLEDYINTEKCYDWSKLLEGSIVSKTLDTPKCLDVPSSEAYNSEITEYITRVDPIAHLYLEIVCEDSVTINGKSYQMRDLKKTFRCINITNIDAEQVGNADFVMPPKIRAQYDQILWEYIGQTGAHEETSTHGEQG